MAVGPNQTGYKGLLSSGNVGGGYPEDASRTVTAWVSIAVRECRLTGIGSTS
jgi:hypothetical protein